MAELFHDVKAELVSQQEVAPGIAIFHFKAEKKIPFTAGQYLQICLPEETTDCRRPYSLSSPPSMMPEFEFLIRRVQGGEFTPKLFNLKPGEKISFMGPIGNFTFDKNDKRDAIFLVTGTGLAPVIGMLKDLEEDDPVKDRKIKLIVGVRFPSDLGYKEYLADLKKRNPNFSFYLFVSDSEDLGGNEGDTGMFDRFSKEPEIAKKYFGQASKDDTCVYLCGHPIAVKATSEYFENLGFKKMKDIKFERYW
ncbi:MAG: hypothetical protein COT81_02120 [Candidatus Buchananbacteria bacterium CG10_big_fil_rev_8_21_14_0_10_42_9]|uniref:FAD-binding FR-type domain-containing protein n=1 Tax=Candidatus Buchananbacteria bacterium CG10_big_fil_rev_8_21_14_0_10_42_9 TaxID=1974526 RepID=A0A2H0W1M2_9BACT|nr:MAG: hypothetical protein COT81_02120 [Candidatus Buchananbacteria bacterium CG10_big_fil_rev_8_21_14_0_10_42_9]